MEPQNPILAQHEALEKLITEIYKLDLKSFLVDAAEIVGNHSSENSEMVELLWQCASILPMMDHSGSD